MKSAITNKKSLKISLPVATVSNRFLNSLPRAIINTKIIPTVNEITEVVPFLNNEGVYCPVCPTDLVDDLILMGQVKTEEMNSRAYLFLCTGCKAVSYIPVTKDGEFKVMFANQRNWSMVEIVNPLLSLITNMRFDFEESLLQTAGTNYPKVINEMYSQNDGNPPIICRLKKIIGSELFQKSTDHKESVRDRRKLSMLLSIVELGGRASIRAIALHSGISENTTSETVIEMVKTKMLSPLSRENGVMDEQLFELTPSVIETLKSSLESVEKKKEDTTKTVA